jgi:subtilase family serine protease
VRTTHHGRHRRALAGVGALAVLAAIVFALVGASASKASASPASGRMSVNPLLAGPFQPTPGAKDQFGCQARPISGTAGPRCYSPQQIQQTYGYASLLKNGIDGTGRTIVIVDAFSNPFIAGDLVTFDHQFGLPAPPSFTTIAPQGVPPFDFSNADMVGWAEEITLDVEWAHAMAPGAKIILDEGKSDFDTDLYNAEKYAIDNHIGDVMTQSFGENEACVDPTVFAQWQSLFRQASNQGWSVFASSGDSGASQFNCAGTAAALAPGFPAVDPAVTGVGGTTLNATNDPTGTASPVSGTYTGETAWTEPLLGCNPPDTDDINCSGGGFSTIFPRPFFQLLQPSSPQGPRFVRGVPDVSYDAGVDGGVITRCSPCNIANGLDPSLNVYFIFGGTSAGSPQWAALTADADQLGHHRLGNINPALYFIAATPVYNLAFHDVRTGNNTVADLGGAGYQAAKGWDPVTGLGSPNASVLLPTLVGVSSFLP